MDKAIQYVYTKALTICNILCVNIGEKFTQHFGFSPKEVTFSRIVKHLHEPKDSSSLAITRILFGMLMMLDVVGERGGVKMGDRWLRYELCHFPLIPFITAIPMPYFGLIYGLQWFAALSVMLGYRFKITCTIFTVCHWYFLIIEKSYWNNHSYLYGLVGFLFIFTRANCLWSFDTYLYPSIRKETVPYWNYFLLKYQFFILYFVAGLKKGTAEWLAGYAMENLAYHWVFTPFWFIMTPAEIDFLVVHCFAFVFDLTIAFWLMWGRTRPTATVFCALFHLMNSRMFTIGMFPWLCLSTIPLFYSFDWPKTAKLSLKIRYENYKKFSIKKYICHKANTICCKLYDTGDDDNCHINKEVTYEQETSKKISPVNIETKEQTDVQKYEESNSQVSKPGDKSENISDYITTYFIILYMIIQAFLPFSHFITKGFNNWTDGIYGYSWDMMVHTLDASSAEVKVVDNNYGYEYFVEPSFNSPNRRWYAHADMVVQYAQCIKEKFMIQAERINLNCSGNISVYIDVWFSLNGRFSQRHYNPNVDLSQARWSVFEKASFLMPLLEEGRHWRTFLSKAKHDFYANESDHGRIYFFAEFPGYAKERYHVDSRLMVSITALWGKLLLEPNVTNAMSSIMEIGIEAVLYPGVEYKVRNVGNVPAYYMYAIRNIPIHEEELELPVSGVGGGLLEKLFSTLLFMKLVAKCFIHGVWFVYNDAAAFISYYLRH